jgi:hypothetical protein
LVALGLDMAGFGRAGAVEAMREIAPRVPLIAFHDRPTEIMRAATRDGFAAVLPRSIDAKSFMYAVACALPDEGTMAAAAATTTSTRAGQRRRRGGNRQPPALKR